MSLTSSGVKILQDYMGQCEIDIFFHLRGEERKHKFLEKGSCYFVKIVIINLLFDQRFIGWHLLLITLVDLA